MEHEHKNIVIIGAGNVATHLGRALMKAGHDILKIINRSETSGRELAEELQTHFDTDFSNIPVETDIVIIAVKDEAVAEIAAQLNTSAIITHTSGSVEMNALDKFNNHGVFYPLQTFHKQKEVDISEVPFCIEANNKENEITLADLAESISENVHFISSEQRRIIHVAAVFACNFTNHFYAIAEDILHQHKMSFDVLKPLIRETSSQVQGNSPKSLQTGPAIRGDEEVMQRHLEFLESSPQYQQLYKLLSDSIQRFKT